MPIAVIDIGSNSIRLMVYDSLQRALIPIFNERAVVGLAGGVARDGLLARGGMDKTLKILRRYKALCGRLNVGNLQIFATAAVRQASNRAEFTCRVEEIFSTKLRVVSGKQEARLAALGVLAGIGEPNGIVGDFGGGSLELTGITSGQITQGMSLKCGSLWLERRSGGDLKKAAQIAHDELHDIDLIGKMGKRNIYAVGGTWRAIMRMDMIRRNYPLQVIHHYQADPDAICALCREITANDPSGQLQNLAPEQRWTLLPYGAIMLETLIEHAKPAQIIVSALGVREGLLYEMLSAEEQAKDPLLSYALDYAKAHTHTLEYVQELPIWTDQLFAVAAIKENGQERRLRHAACLLSDIGWRAYPDHRAAQTHLVLGDADFGGIDHAARAFLALTSYFRYEKSGLATPDQGLIELAGENLEGRAKILGAAFRLADSLGAASPTIIPKTAFRRLDGQLILEMDPEIADLSGERVERCIQRLGRIAGYKGHSRIRELSPSPIA